MPKESIKDADGVALKIGDSVVFIDEDASDPAHVHIVSKIGVYMVCLDNGKLVQWANHVRKVLDV